MPVNVKRTITNGISTNIKIMTSLYCRYCLGKKNCMVTVVVRDFSNSETVHTGESVKLKQ